MTRMQPRPAITLFVRALLASVVIVLLATGQAQAAPRPAPSAAAPAAAPAPATAPHAGGTSVPAGCNASSQRPRGKPRAQCYAMMRAGADGKITANATGPRPGALGPADIQAAYHLPSTGEGQTVAIVDAYGDSKAESDLAVFRSYYGLPPCTSDNGCFQKVDQTGGTNYPGDDGGWAFETALDLDAVSAACPNCHILLVQANDNGFDNLGTAVDTAVRLGAKYVSNSYGLPNDFPGEQDYDHYYNHPGVAVTASTGDTGDVTNWPATNPHVVAVGGTSLTKDDSQRAWHESPWGGGGSGCSPYEPQPDYQQSLATNCGMRAIADVSAVADPATGLAVYDTLGQPGWVQAGGTSLSSPLVAAMYALAGTPTANTYPVTYPYQRPGSLFDITEGTNGTCGDVLCNAGPGWDGPTGLGTPDGVTALSTVPTGDLAGKVTDKDTGAAVAGATVSVAPNGYSATTAADGSYDLTIPLGTYDVTAQAYGYTPATTTGLQVSEGQTTAANLELASVPSRTVSGTVTDGSGHGWPLYARITIDGYPHGPIYTDPYTGEYSVSLPQGGTYAMHVNTVSMPGYLPATVQADLGTADTTLDVKLDADPDTCIAPGYSYDGTTEQFTNWAGTTARNGWTNVDNVGKGAAWQFDNPMTQSGPVGGDADFAAVQPGLNPFETHQDTSLISPVLDLSGQTAPELGFDTLYQAFANQAADVDLSVDGGQTWATVWHQDSDNVSSHVDVALPPAAGKANVRLRFHLAGTSENSNSLGWAVDNVFVGAHTCTARPGGIVAGQVTDDNTGDPVNGAKVADGLGSSSVSTATPDDASVADGFYWLESSASGNQQFTVTDGLYTPGSATVNVAADALTRHDWALRAGHLTASPGDAAITERLGASTTKKFTVTNDGTAPMHMRLGEQHGGFTPMSRQAAAAKGAPLERIKVSGHLDPLGLNDSKAASTSTTASAPRESTPASAPWTSLADYPVPVTNNAVASDAGKIYSVGGIVGPGEFTDAAYVYDPADQRWNPIATAPYGMDGGAAAFLNGRLYVVGGIMGNLQATAAMYAYDPVGGTWTRGADLPKGIALARAAVLDGKLYVIGGCLDAGCTLSPSVYRYDPASAAWTTLADYPVPAAAGACAGIVGEIVCAGGASTHNNPNLNSTYIYHPGSDTWTRGADMPFTDWGMAYSGANGKLQIAAGVMDGQFITNQAAEYDPVRNTWKSLPNANHAEEGGGSACGLAKVGGEYTFPGGQPEPFSELFPGYDQCTPEVNWLSESKTDLDLAAGQSASITVTIDSSVLTQPGDYAASLWIDTDTPYQSRPIGITTQVLPPTSWGKATGTVSDSATGAPIGGASVVICTMYDKGSGACGPVTYTLRSDLSGQFQLWLDRGYSPVQISAAKDGYRPVATIVKVTAGATATVNFSLKRS